MRKNHVLMNFTIFVVFLGLSYGIYVFNQSSLSYISISINPDVELAVNADNVVKGVISINKDADIITSDLALVGTNVEDAIIHILDAAIETGYIDEYSDENTVVVTSTNENEKVRTKLEEKAVKELNNRLQERNIYAVVVANGVNETIKDEALKYNVSNGKMLLINRLVVLNPDLSKEDLATMSIKDIQSKIQEYVKERHKRMNLGTSKEIRKAMKEAKKTLKAECQVKIETFKAALLDDVGVNIDKLTETERKELIKEQLQTRKEEIKENVNKVKDEINNSLKNITSPSAIKDQVDNIRNQVKKGKITN